MEMNTKRSAFFVRLVLGLALIAQMIGSVAFPTSVRAAITNRYESQVPVDNPLAGRFQNMLLQVAGTWSALGMGLNGTVFAIAISGSDVYVGGLSPMQAGM
jgi:hypothetical protein